MGSDPGSPSSFWAQYPTIPAVRAHRVVGYPEDPTLHPGPRIVQTLEILARLIHPEAFTRDPDARNISANDSASPAIANELTR
jgi:hypothetical protein